MNKLNKLFTALVRNKEKLTAKQIAVRYDVANPYDLVYQIRLNGYPINLNTWYDSKGRQTNKYQFGNAPREVIAAGYKALAAGLV